MIVASQIALQHGALRCGIDARGAELRSLTDVTSGEEFIWQGDPAYWTGSAPILFPVVGRLKGGAYTHGGQRYELPIHGFARTMDFTLLDQHRQGATLMLRDTPATRAMYPFPFILRVNFTLEMHCLRVSYEVENPGRQPLLFSLGSHPAFRLPPSPRGRRDWLLAFSDEEDGICHRLDGNLLAELPETLDFAPGYRLRLCDELFERDAIFIKQLRSRHIRLVHRSGRVRLSVTTGGTPSLGLWSRPGAGYICIEPWHGYDDDAGVSGELAAKPGIVSLAAGSIFRTAYTVCVPPAQRFA